MTTQIGGTTGITFPDSSTQNTAATGFGFKNRIINGAMMIDQRNAGASVTPTSGGVYTLDRWKAWEDTDGSATVQQSTTTTAGFSNSLVWTTTSADASLGSTQYACIGQFIEGFNVADFGWGTANASSVTLSFWVRSSLTGTFGGAFSNNDANRSYPFTYTVSAANTWEQKTITVAGDTSGTWTTDNTSGIKIYLGLGVGSTYSGTAGSWSGSFYLSATGATSVVGTNGATFYITGVQLEKGSTATSFDYRPYGTELALCQRYFEKSFPQGTAPVNGVAGSNYMHISFSPYGSGNGWFSGVFYKVTKRTNPTLTLYGGADTTGNNWGYYNGGWTTVSTSTDWGNDNGFGLVGTGSGFTSGTTWPGEGMWTSSAEL